MVVLINAFRKIVAKDYDLQRVQENCALAFKQVLEKELLDGVMVTATITNAPTSVSHTLGRQPLGWFIVDKQATGDVWRTAWNDRIITLVSGAASLPVTIWVF
jgi:hypothetical protein